MLEESGLAHAGLAVQHDRAAKALLNGGDQVVEDLPLVLPIEQRRRRPGGDVPTMLRPTVAGSAASQASSRSGWKPDCTRPPILRLVVAPRDPDQRVSTFDVGR